jgi:hypothetical protein
LFETGAFAAELLRPVGRVPDPGVFQFAADFGQPLALQIVFKETS